MKTIVFASGKGGVGKTSDAVLLAVAIAKLHPGKVLLIDLDPNNNATDMTLRDTDVEAITGHNIFNVLQGLEKIEEAMFKSNLNEGLTIVPAIPRLAKIGHLMGDNPGLYLKFPALIRKLNFDYVIFDTPPALTLELRIALYTANIVIVPVNGNRWTVQGFDLILEEIKEIEEITGKRPKVFALPSMITEKKAIQLKQYFGESVQFTKASIIKLPAIEKAGTLAILPKDDSPAQQMFAELAKEVL